MHGGVVSRLPDTNQKRTMSFVFSGRMKKKRRADERDRNRDRGQGGRTWWGNALLMYFMYERQGFCHPAIRYRKEAVQA